MNILNTMKLALSTTVDQWFLVKPIDQIRNSIPLPSILIVDVPPPPG